MHVRTLFQECVLSNAVSVIGVSDRDLVYDIFGHLGNVARVQSPQRARSLAALHNPKEEAGPEYARYILLMN